MVDCYPISICNWVPPSTSRGVHVIKYKPRYFHTDTIYGQPVHWNGIVSDVSWRIQTVI